VINSEEQASTYQSCCPEVQRSSSGESTADLGHAQTDKTNKEGHKDPTPDGHNGTSCGHSESKEGDDTDQHRSVRQGESKVLQS